MSQGSGKTSSWSALRRDASSIASTLRVLKLMKSVGPNKAVTYTDTLQPFFEKRRDRPALIGETSRMTWGELDAYANRVAHWALGEGLGRGDVVGFSMENRPEYIATWLGLSRVGVVSALFNTNLEGERLAHCVREAAPRHWIVGEELLDSAQTALPFLEEAPALLVSRDQPFASEVTSPGLSGVAEFNEKLANQSAAAVPAPAKQALRAGDGIFLIYTSGTTGLPKAAKISHTKAIITGGAARLAQGLTPSDRVYCCLPLYHSAGGMMAVGAGLSAGGALVLARKFSAKRFWSDCAQNDVTSIQYIGELCRYLLNSPTHPDERNHQIRSALGNGLRPDIWTEFKDRFAIPRIVEFYGATEGNTALVNFHGKVGAVGHMPRILRKAAGVDVLRFDVEAEEVVRGDDGFCVSADFEEAGEVVIKISETTRFEGYTNPEATEKKILRDVFKKGDAYFRTGDLLRLDAEGYFYFVDRIGDTFRWKGENVATSEISEVISALPGVHEANVYGVEIPGTDGRAGMAAIVTSEEFDLEALGDRIESELAFYARPVFIRLLPEMEITGTFKHRKVDLVREGFHPEEISDPIFVRDAEKGRYVPLDLGRYEQIQAAEIRL